MDRVQTGSLEGETERRRRRCDDPYAPIRQPRAGGRMQCRHRMHVCRRRRGTSVVRGFDREVRVDLHQNCHASRRYVDVELLVEEAECAEAAGIEFGVAALPVQHMVEQASKLVRAGAKAPSPCSGHHRCRRRG